MVLGVLTAVGVTFIAGYVAHAYAINQGNDQQRNRVELQRQLKELKKSRSSSGRCYFFTLILLFAFLIALGSILYATNFFRSQKSLSTRWLDWDYWLNYDNYKIYYNYPGIAGVAVTVVLVVFPLLIILCKLCWDVTSYEKQLKETREELEQLQQDRRVGGDIAFAQGGWVNIAIANCFNVHCTCYITVVFTYGNSSGIFECCNICLLCFVYLSFQLVSTQSMHDYVLFSSRKLISVASYNVYVHTVVSYCHFECLLLVRVLEYSVYASAESVTMIVWLNYNNCIEHC
jgi:hypothetical protein